MRDPSQGKKGNPDRFIFLLSFPRETSGLCKAICWVFHCFILKVSAIGHSALLISHHCLRDRFFIIWDFAFMKFTLFLGCVVFFFSFLSFSCRELLQFDFWLCLAFFREVNCCDKPCKKWEGVGETLVTDMALVKALCQGKLSSEVWLHPKSTAFFSMGDFELNFVWGGAVRGISTLLPFASVLLN